MKLDQKIHTIFPTPLQKNEYNIIISIASAMSSENFQQRPQAHKKKALYKVNYLRSEHQCRLYLLKAEYQRFFHRKTAIGVTGRELLTIKIM